MVVEVEEEVKRPPPPPLGPMLLLVGLNLEGFPAPPPLNDQPLSTLRVEGVVVSVEVRGGVVV